MSEVIIYTKDICPYCLKAKNLLIRKHIAYQEINITTEPEKYEELKEETNFYTVPQIFIDGEFIGGCDDLYELERTGQLDEKIKKEL